MRSLGKVAALYRYPVKSLQGERLEGAYVSRNGFPGDRLWAFYEPGGRPASAKRHPKLMLASSRFVEEPHDDAVPHAEISLPGGTIIRTDAPDCSARVSDWHGTPMEVKAGTGKHFDDLPLHIVTTKSLESLRKLKPDTDFDVLRFRPNILIELSNPTEDFPELAWIGKTLRVGNAVLKIEKATKRCIMTTHVQPSLRRDLAVLEIVVREAQARLGVYASVQKPGTVALGDGFA